MKGEDLITNEIVKNMNQQSRGRVLKMLEQCRTESKRLVSWALPMSTLPPLPELAIQYTWAFPSVLCGLRCSSSPRAHFFNTLRPATEATFQPATCWLTDFLGGGHKDALPVVGGRVCERLQSWAHHIGLKEQTKSSNCTLQLMYFWSVPPNREKTEPLFTNHWKPRPRISNTRITMHSKPRRSTSQFHSRSKNCQLASAGKSNQRTCPLQPTL